MQARLTELYCASRSLSEPLGQEAESSFDRFTEQPSLISVINLTDLAIKRIIKMSKQIFAFKQLCQEDQVQSFKKCVERTLSRWPC